jgi:hypothetical protein
VYPYSNYINPICEASRIFWACWPLRSSGVGLYVAIFYFVAYIKVSTFTRAQRTTSISTSSPHFSLSFLIFKTRKSAHYELDSKTIITQDRKHSRIFFEKI